MSHLQLIGSERFSEEEIASGKDQIKDLAVRPFTKTSETLKVVPSRHFQLDKRASRNLKNMVPKKPNPKIAMKKSKGWACLKNNCGYDFI